MRRTVVCHTACSCCKAAVRYVKHVEPRRRWGEGQGVQRKGKVHRELRRSMCGVRGSYRMMDGPAIPRHHSPGSLGAPTSPTCRKPVGQPADSCLHSLISLAQPSPAALIHIPGTHAHAPVGSPLASPLTAACTAPSCTRPAAPAAPARGCGGRRGRRARPRSCGGGGGGGCHRAAAGRAVGSMLLEASRIQGTKAVPSRHRASLPPSRPSPAIPTSTVLPYCLHNTYFERCTSSEALATSSKVSCGLMA